jgi:dTDP-glucose 4,6-dehydratase
MRVLVTGGGIYRIKSDPSIIDQPEIELLVNLDCLTYAGHLENLEGVAAHPKFVFENVDLRNKLAVFEVLKNHRISHVMHLAAESHVDRSITGPGDFIQTNVIGRFACETCRGCEPHLPSPRYPRHRMGKALREKRCCARIAVGSTAGSG